MIVSSLDYFPPLNRSLVMKPFKFSLHTLDSGINVGVRLLIFEKFLRGGATVIPGATFIPESRVSLEHGQFPLT